MDLRTRAKNFAINAHKGQVRKSEPEKPMVIHPLTVGDLLYEYAGDENLACSGYLHDVVEDTPYAIEDIKKEFGSDIASLVASATEPDKSLSWEERKQHTIDEIKDLPLRNKLLICADKINNLEDLLILFEKTSKRDFSSFKRGEDKQRWYYTSIYESLITNEDPNHPMFRRLKDVIDKVFYEKEDAYLKEVIFKDNLSYYEALKSLDAYLRELVTLRKLSSDSKPFVIEFTGTPRTGKTTTIKSLYDFFKKGGLSTSVVEEFTTSKEYQENIKRKLSTMSSAERNLAIINYTYEYLLKALDSNKDIVILDRSLNDRLIWNYTQLKKGYMSKEQYEQALEKYSIISRELIDYLVISYTDALTTLRRDYLSSLSLKPRSFLNEDNVNEFNSSLESMEDIIRGNVDNSIFINTTNENLQDTSLAIAEDIVPIIRKRYLNNLKDKL